MPRSVGTPPPLTGPVNGDVDRSGAADTGLVGRAAALRGSPDPFVTKDSGERRQFSTGSQRDKRDGKGRYDLLPPLAIRRVAQLYERGAKKYEANNWRKGQPLSVYVDSMLRHAFQVAGGQADEDHAAAVVFNALAIIDHQERIRAGDLPADLDDIGITS